MPIASDTEETDSDESVGRIIEHEGHLPDRSELRQVQGGDHGDTGSGPRQAHGDCGVQALVDSGVHKTLLSESDWKVMIKKNKL